MCSNLKNGDDLEFLSVKKKKKKKIQISRIYDNSNGRGIMSNNIFAVRHCVHASKNISDLLKQEPPPLFLPLRSRNSPWGAHLINMLLHRSLMIAEATTIKNRRSKLNCSRMESTARSAKSRLILFFTYYSGVENRVSNSLPPDIKGTGGALFENNGEYVVETTCNDTRNLCKQLQKSRDTKEMYTNIYDKKDELKFIKFNNPAN